MTVSIIGRPMFYHGTVYDSEQGLDYTYYGELVIEEADANERGAWYNAVLLPVADENNPRWVTLDLGIACEPIYFVDSPLPFLGGLFSAFCEDVVECVMVLDELFDYRLGGGL
jgi:hypothetical protein